MSLSQSKQALRCLHRIDDTIIDHETENTDINSEISFDEMMQSLKDNVTQMMLSEARIERDTILLKQVAVIDDMYKRTADDRYLIEVIGLEREALTLRPPGHPDRARSCGNLAVSLSTRYSTTGDDNLLMEAIDLGQEALTLRPPGHPDRARYCANLATSLSKRYDTTGDDDLLMRAIVLEQEALNLRPPGHPDRATSCGKLAVSLKRRYNATGNDDILMEAIDLQREALTMHFLGHPYRAASCGNLAVLLKSRYDTTGDDDLLTEAIDLDREALTLCPPGHSDRASSCGNLAIALKKRYNTTGDHYLLIKTIDLEREALTLRPPGHPDRARYCANLAFSLSTRYNTTGDDDLLMEAIDLQREALTLHPSGHPDRASYCENLANLLKTLYDTTGNDDLLLMEATDLEREALTLRPPGHPHRARSCGNLAGLLFTRYKTTGNDDLFMEAIALQREALTLRPPGHPDHAGYCGNLAASLKIRFSHTGNHILLDEIRTLGKESLFTSDPGNRWRPASVLIWLHLQTGTNMFDVRKTIQYLHESLIHHPDNFAAAISVTVYYLDLVWKIADAQQLEHHVALAPIYRRLVQLLPFLTNPVLETHAQLHALHNVNQIGSDAFVNAVLAENWSLGLEDMEFVKGLLLSQRLHYRDPQLQDVPSSLAYRLKDHMQALSVFSVNSGVHHNAITRTTPRDIQHNHAAQVYALLQEIRELPGLDRFMLGETYISLCSVASEHPVVVIVGSRGRVYAVLLTSGTTSQTLLPLDWSMTNYNSDSSEKPAARSCRGSNIVHEVSCEDNTERAYKKQNTVPPRPASRRMRYLWFKIVKPVLERLDIHPAKGRARPRLHWCPTGEFSALPLHAAGIYDGPVASHIGCRDYVVSSYTSTLTSLLRIQKVVLPMFRDSFALALVAEKRAKEPELPVIPQVDKEVSVVARVAVDNSVTIVHQTSGSTTVADTSAAVELANIVHLACHGIQDTGDATKSGFCLGDGRLTIARLMEMKLDKAFLAFLSACETAKGDAKQPDQAMHLAAAMVFAGFKSVIATMWSISDIDGPKVAKWFYQELFAKVVINASDVAYALDTAVDNLRKEGVSLDRWAPFIHMGA